jgi:hypothetical protein
MEDKGRDEFKDEFLAMMTERIFMEKVKIKLRY